MDLSAGLLGWGMAAKLDKELLFDGGVEGVGFLLEPDEVPLFGCKMHCK